MEEVGSKSSEESEEESEGSEGGLEEPTGELVEKLTKKPAEEPVVGHSALGQESQPEGSQGGEQEVVVHMLEDEIDHLC